MVVNDVAVKDTTLIPKDVLSTAAVASGLLGSNCGVEELQTCARYIDGWYASNGYRVSRVVRAELLPEKG
ncbi:unnamed protein product, partial [Phaeothamnion confervicola]